MRSHSEPRVLFVDQTGQLGGAELSLLELVPRLPVRPTVLLFEAGPFQGELEAVGVPVLVESGAASVMGVRREGQVGLQVLPALARLVVTVARRARSYDLLYANTQKAFAVAALAGRLARRPVLWHLRDLLTPEHFSRTNRMVAVGLANTCAARVVANSQATGRAFVEAGGRADRVCVVYNGIDAAPFDAVRPEEAETLRADLGLSGMRVVGVFGRLAPWKGQHVLVRALPRLPGVHALLVGGPFFGAEPYERELRELAAEVGVADRTHFLGFRGDIPRLMACCDVVVHTSTSAEPFGRVVVEAMLAGRPVVAARAGGVPEIVEDGVSGLLIPPGDPEELAATLRTLLVDGAQRARLAAAASVRARRDFGPSATAEGVARVIDGVVPLSAQHKGSTQSAE